MLVGVDISDQGGEEIMRSNGGGGGGEKYRDENHTVISYIT